MLNNISWQGYWTTIALLTTGYYLSIYLLFFRTDFKILYRGKATNNENSIDFTNSNIKRQDVSTQSPTINDFDEFQSPEVGSEEAVVYACIDELDAFFQESKKAKCLKSELISSLQIILKKYPTLKGSGYKASLTNVIVGQCEHICSIHLDADDVVRVWSGE